MSLSLFSWSCGGTFIESIQTRVVLTTEIASIALELVGPCLYRPIISFRFRAAYDTSASLSSMFSTSHACFLHVFFFSFLQYKSHFTPLIMSHITVFFHVVSLCELLRISGFTSGHFDHQVRSFDQLCRLSNLFVFIFCFHVSFNFRVLCILLSDFTSVTLVTTIILDFQTARPIPFAWSMLHLRLFIFVVPERIFPSVFASILCTSTVGCIESGLAIPWRCSSRSDNGGGLRYQLFFSNDTRHFRFVHLSVRKQVLLDVLLSGSDDTALWAS